MGARKLQNAPAVRDGRGYWTAVGPSESLFAGIDAVEAVGLGTGEGEDDMPVFDDGLARPDEKRLPG